MARFNVTDEFFDTDEIDVALAANNHLFSNGPDLFEAQLNQGNFDNNFSDQLRALVDEAHPTEVSVPLPTLSASVSESFDFDSLNSIDFGHDQMGLAPLPNQSMVQPLPQQMSESSPDLNFNQVLPPLPLVSASTIAPAALAGNDMSLSRIAPAPFGTPDGFTWSPNGTNNPVQMLGVDHQQQWAVFANPQNQLYQPQPTTAQVQYMQAAQQLQFAQVQLAHSIQPPFQPPLNAQAPPVRQSPQVRQSLQVRQSPLNSQEAQSSLLLSEEDEPVDHTQAIGQDHPDTPLFSTASSETTVPSSTVAKATADLREEPQDPARQRKSRATRTVRKVSVPEPVDDESLTEQRFEGLKFTSLQHAETEMTTRLLRDNWQAPTPDDTIPLTDKARASWVLQLFDAMQDTSECKDNKAGFSFIKRWEAPGYYDLQEMEKVCWHMCDIAERLHAHGPSVTKIYCKDALKKVYASRNLTFEQRIVAICEMLRLSKFLCDNLMKGEGIEMLVCSPKQKLSGAKTMMVQNKKRQGWLISGRRADPSRSNGDTDLAEDDDEERIVDTADLPAPSQRKTKQKSKRSGPTTKANARANARSRQITRENSDDDDYDEDADLSRRQSVNNNATGDVDGDGDELVSPSSASSLSPVPESPPVSSSYPLKRGLKRGFQALQTDMPPRKEFKIPNSWIKGRSVDATELESGSEDSATPAKRTRTASYPGREAVQDSDAESLSDQDLSSQDEEEAEEEVGDSQDGENSEDSHDGEDDESDPLSSDLSPPPPSPIRKRKRDTIPRRGRLVMTQPRVVEIDPSSESEGSESEGSESEDPESDAPDSEDSQSEGSDSEDEPAPPAKRAKKGGNMSARESSIRSPPAKNTSARSGRPQRNSRGQFLPRGCR